MDIPPAGIPSPNAAGPQLLTRLTAPLRQAGWRQNDPWYDMDEEDQEVGAHAAYSEFSRSGFHIGVVWDPAEARLAVDDPAEGWDWDESLPALFPLDEPLIVDLSRHSTQAAKAEATRLAFAEAGLLDATRIHLPDNVKALRHDLGGHHSRCDRSSSA